MALHMAAPRRTTIPNTPVVVIPRARGSQGHEPFEGDTGAILRLRPRPCYGQYRHKVTHDGSTHAGGGAGTARLAAKAEHGENRAPAAALSDHRAAAAPRAPARAALCLRFRRWRGE